MSSPEFVLYIATSLDGYIAKSDGSIDWLPPIDPTTDDFGYNEFYAKIDALVMGATTYEQVLGFGEWPYLGKPTIVLTRRSLPAPHPEIQFIQDGIEAAVTYICQQGYRCVWVVGGGQLASAMMRQGLIQEFLITVMPILLGDGISLYQAIPEQSLQLIHAKPFAFGGVELAYRLSATTLGN